MKIHFVAISATAGALLYASADAFLSPSHGNVHRRATLHRAREKVDSQPPTPPTPPPLPDDPESRLNVNDILGRTNSPPPPKRNLTPQEEKLALAAGVGGFVLGGILGGVVDLQNPDIDLYISPVVPPVLGAVALSAVGAVGGGGDGDLAKIVRVALGGPTIAIGNAIVSSVQGAIDSAVDSAKNKVKETTDDIKAIPENIKKAAVQKVEETKEEIAAIPSRVKEAAVEAATEIAEEIKATPGRVVEKIEQVVEDAVDDTLDAVEEFVDDVKALPQKAIDGVEDSINSLLGNPQVPRPPLAPPVLDDASREKTPGPPREGPPPPAITERPLIPKIDSLKIEPPKLEIPKISVPAFEVPKVSLPTLEVPKSSPPKIVPPSKEAPSAPVAKQGPKEDSIDRVKLASVRKEILFDEKTGRFFEQGAVPKIEAPKFETPKFDLPKLEVPKFNLPSVPAPATEAKTAANVSIASKNEAKKLAEEKRKQDEEARKAALLKQKEAAAKAEESAKVKRQRQVEAERKAEEARAEAEERKRALELARQRKLDEQAREAEKRKQQLEERRKQVEAVRAAQIDKVKKQQAEQSAAALKAKRQEAAEKSLDQAKSRTTISLGSLFGFGSEQDEIPEPSGPKKSAPKPQVSAPPGVPILSNWRQNSDGSITGKISGSPIFSNGEAVTTSPVPKGATSGTVVKTSSGSRYFLDQQATFGFSFGGGVPAASTPPQAAVEKQKQIAEEKKAAAAAATEAKRRAEAERLAASAAAAALERKKIAEERKAAADAQRLAAENAKAAAEQKRAAAAAEAKKREADAREAAAEAKRREAADRTALQAAAAAEKQKVAENRRAAAAASLEQRKTPPKAEQPPKGVPIIRSWKQRSDGGVSGRIYNSRSFSDGDFIETSPITKGSIQDGSVVATSSGSRYFLSAEPAVNKAGMFSAIKDIAGAQPGATITLTRERKAREAKAAVEAIEKAKPRSTFSLFGLGFGGADADDLPSPKPTLATPKASPKVAVPAKPSATAPRGVPTLSRWKKNSDGSVTGVISGSSAFGDGERVTTSPIKNGTVAKSEVVVTGSGSKYFLA